MYNNFEIDNMLASMVILVDTREQDTPAFRKRLEGFKCPSERHKLNFGDYSAKVKKPDGEWLYFDDKISVERKMNLDEICQCFTKGRQRFEKEFHRSYLCNARIHILIENGSWDKVINGSYRSKLDANALVASLLAWSVRYNAFLSFATPENSPLLIKKILHYEIRELLGNKKND